MLSEIGEICKIKKVSGYSPQIGHLVSMMNYARFTTLNEVKGLNIDQLDFMYNDNSNSIGALLWHIAAVEFGFQTEIFEGRMPNREEVEEWQAAYGLGEIGRNKIKGKSLEFYINKLNDVRQRTLEEFKKLEDSWLYIEREWEGHLSNNYFIWFHVFEDELNHRGQIRWLRKRMGEYEEG
ncbi:DinB family protein [Scopulibacillus darangshiensis]